jgi:2,3-bisphosphoglycerate-independent phosphoglycerate mutase
VKAPDNRKFVLVVPDGAADVHRERGLSPLAAARTEGFDFLAREGVCGLMQTLYPDLAKGSIVAQLGMLGWDPRRYYPHGRASCEILALEGVRLEESDLIFRANLVTMEGRRLASYNAHYIQSARAATLIERINAANRERFPAFELYHNSDFRNTLVIRGAGVDPRLFLCSEPHESEGREFDVERLVGFRAGHSDGLASTINEYVACAARVLAGETANMLFPWSASKPLALPTFAANTGFHGRAGVVGSMDFLHGIARAGGIDFYKTGNGRPMTDYVGKGARVLELLARGYSFVVCHINGPDEASHMGDLELKIRSLEAIDRHIVRPVVEYFSRHPEELGGVMIAPDHYTNHSLESRRLSRTEAHSIHPVPFAVWNGRDRDEVQSFDEDAVRRGRYGNSARNHLELLRLLGVV